jgi:hypothetical protein
MVAPALASVIVTVCGAGYVPAATENTGVAAGPLVVCAPLAPPAAPPEQPASAKPHTTNPHTATRPARIQLSSGIPPQTTTPTPAPPSTYFFQASRYRKFLQNYSSLADS